MAASCAAYTLSAGLMETTLPLGHHPMFVPPHTHTPVPVSFSIKLGETTVEVLFVWCVSW